MGEGDQILFVLCRHETGRDFVEAPAREKYKTGIERQSDGAFANDRADAGGVFVAGPGKNPIERPEEPTKGLIHEARGKIFGRVVPFQQ